MTYTSRLNVWFNLLNSHVFDNELPQIPIKMIDWEMNLDYAGRFHIEKIVDWQAREIEIVENTDMTMLTTLLHEMVHYHCFLKHKSRQNLVMGFHGHGKVFNAKMTFGLHKIPKVIKLIDDFDRMD